MRIKNGLVVGVILLFLGLAIQPSVAIVQPESIDVELDVEELVAQLRIVINEKLEINESKPILAGFWDIIRDIITEIWGIIVALIVVMLLLF
jgi:hypothetical protein